MPDYQPKHAAFEFRQPCVGNTDCDICRANAERYDNYVPRHALNSVAQAVIDDPTGFTNYCFTNDPHDDHCQLRRPLPAPSPDRYAVNARNSNDKRP